MDEQRAANERGGNRTDAQIRAQRKYKNKTETMIGCHVKREDGDAFRDWCKENGTTPNAVLSEFIRSKIEK